MNTTDNQPALQPPPGEHSDFEHPSASLQPTIIGTLAACLAISTLSMIARGFAQLYLFKRPIWADFWIVLAWACHVAFAAMLLVTLPYGAGYHMWDVHLSDYYKIEFYLYVSFVLYDGAILGAKVSILLQLSALFAGPRRNRFYWASMFLIAVNIIFYFALSIALIWQCKPISKAWNPTIEGTCVNQDSLLTSSGPFNIVSDFLIFLLPIWAIWQLHLPLRRRLEVISAFAVGLFGCLCSAVRLAYSKRLSESGDATWVIMQNQLWANAEITAGILIASIFILPRLYRNMRGQNTSYPYHGYNNRPSQNTYADGSNTGNRNSNWDSRRSGVQGKRYSRDPYFELMTESERGLDDLSIVAESTNESHDEHARAPTRNSHMAQVDGNNSGVIEGGIVKTVEIETTEERVVPTAPKPVAVPGMAL